MTTTRIMLLGWLEHCEREHSGQGTHIPMWLCSIDAVREAVEDGDVCQNGTAPMWGMSFVVWGLTDKGRAKLYPALQTPTIGPSDGPMTTCTVTVPIVDGEPQFPICDPAHSL
jgi:hypothetical protein